LALLRADGTAAAAVAVIEHRFRSRASSAARPNSSRIRFVLEEAGVGWVPFMFWRFDREYHFGGPETRVFKPDIPLSQTPSEIVRKHLFFTFEVEEEGGFRRVPEIGFENFLWASDFPGLDSPWPHSKSEGHAPVEAALGKDALSQLVFENAVRIYNIPVIKLA
jgi:hypothetical protein